MFSDFYSPRFISNQLNGYDRPVKADAFTEHDFAASIEANAAAQSH
jgi:hypothetical protein